MRARRRDVRHPAERGLIDREPFQFGLVEMKQHVPVRIGAKLGAKILLGQSTLLDERAAGFKTPSKSRGFGIVWTLTVSHFTPCRFRHISGQ